MVAMSMAILYLEKNIEEISITPRTITTVETVTAVTPWVDSPLTRCTYAWLRLWLVEWRLLRREAQKH